MNHTNKRTVGGLSEAAESPSKKPFRERKRNRGTIPTVALFLSLTVLMLGTLACDKGKNGDAVKSATQPMAAGEVAASSRQVEQSTQVSPAARQQESGFNAEALSALVGKKVRWTGSVQTIGAGGKAVTVLLSSSTDAKGKKTVYLAEFALSPDGDTRLSPEDRVTFEGILQEGMLVREEGVFENYFDRVVKQSTTTLVIAEPAILSVERKMAGKPLGD